MLMHTTGFLLLVEGHVPGVCPAKYQAIPAGLGQCVERLDVQRLGPRREQ